LNTSLVFGRDRFSLMQDCSEGTVRERLEFVVCQRRPVPLGGSLCHYLIVSPFIDYSLDDGLSEGRL
jgi:hypothetical protein